MESIESHKTLHELNDALLEDARSCPEEMTDAILSCCKTVREALNYELNPVQEKRLCDYIRDKLIDWCYNNKIMY